MKTLTEHNAERQTLWDQMKAQAAEERKAGVLCPQCKAAGHDVEMQKDTLGRSSSGKQSVICPECGHHGEMA